MELTLQTNKSALFIKNYEDSCLYIADKVYDHNIVIVENIISKWNIDNIYNLKIDDFEDIVNTKPEIIIIGTGKEPVIPKLEIIKNIQDRQIGIEFMRTESACKTFNLLLSEERNVACILLV